MNLPVASDPVGSGFDVSRLLVPRAYPHAIDELRLKETHLSWLILTGPFAYKVKKPLQNEFIDTSTLERRRDLCEEELRLNRRLASELYVDVLPIAEDLDGLRIGGQGRTIEYAVRMRQFETADELDHLLDANAVSVAEIADLADLIASFHAHATPAVTTCDTAHASRTFDVVLGNLTELLSQLYPDSSPASVGRIARWLQESLETHRTALDERWASGYVRDCHGDLHAGNIVRFRQRLLPFDCLEFNMQLRSIDVLDDLSFLVMDLSGHDRNDLAIALLSRYLEYTGDYAGLRLVPLYAVHRALVRAKVDALSASSMPQRRAEFEWRLQRRLRGADYWSTWRQPILVLMHGPSGSGKSWLSKQLVPSLPAIRIRSDVERKRLAGLTAENSAAADFQEGIYSPRFSNRTYAHLCECAELGLRSGFSVIVDAAFLDAADRELFQGVARRLGIPMAIIACSADPQVLASRIESREKASGSPSDATTKVLARQLERMQPFSVQEQSHVIEVKTPDVGAIGRIVADIRSLTEGTGR